MSYFSQLPPEVYRHRFIKQLSYEELINLCKSEHVNFCDDLLLWKEKMEYEIKIYNSELYGLHEFLREALLKKHYYYFKAALKYYAQEAVEDERLALIFRQYGYMIDDMNIMKKYSTTNDHGLDEAYSSITQKDKKLYQKFLHLRETGSLTEYHVDQMNTTPYIKISNIIKNGYFSIDEYYRIISLSLKEKNITTLKFLAIWSIVFPIKFHPRSNIFDKLIWKYIGFAKKGSEKYRDQEKFQLLFIIYAAQISSPYNLYNLIHNTYEVNSINYAVISLIFPLSLKKTKTWIFDDIESFRKEFVNNKVQTLLKYNELASYNNSLIMNYLINKVKNSNKDDILLQFLAEKYLSIQQLEQILLNLKDESYFEFLKHFIISQIPTDYNVDAQNIYKFEMLINDSRFEKITPEITINILTRISAKPNLTNHDLCVFLRQPRIYKYLCEPIMNEDDCLFTFKMYEIERPDFENITGMRLIKF